MIAILLTVLSYKLINSPIISVLTHLISIVGEILLIVYSQNIIMLLIGSISISITIYSYIVIYMVYKKNTHKIQGLTDVNKTDLVSISIDAIHKLVKRTSQDNCAICLEDNTNSEKQSILKCGHMFHRDCINKVFETKLECPECRFTQTNIKDMIIY